MRPLPLRTVAAILLSLLTVTALGPSVAADDGASMPANQRQDYVAGLSLVPAGTPGLLPDAPLCDVHGTGLNLGGACFELDGQAHQIDLYVFDHGQNALWKHGHDLLNDLADDPLVDTSVGGTYRMLDADGAVLHEGPFCGGRLDLGVPPRAVALEVVLDGGLAGLPVDPGCTTPYSGATTGWIYVTVDW